MTPPFIHSRFTGLRLIAYLIRAIGTVSLILGIFLAIYVVVLTIMVGLEAQQSTPPSAEANPEEFAVITQADFEEAYSSVERGFMLSMAFVAFANGIILYAAGAVILVFLAIEENTRATSEYLLQQTKRQSSSTGQEQFRPYKAPN
jgi:hypothetical protein